MQQAQPVPERFRGIVEDAVRLIADGGVQALASDARIAFAGDDPLLWLREDGVRPVPLPPEAWETSDAWPVDEEPGAWWLVVDLWDAAGRTEHSLEATVRDSADGQTLMVENIHVM